MPKEKLHRIYPPILERSRESRQPQPPPNNDFACTPKPKSGMNQKPRCKAPQLGSVYVNRLGAFQMS